MDDQRIAEPGGPTGPRPDAPQRPPGTLRIGQIGGVDVLVRSSWLLVAALISVMLAPAVEQVEPGLGAWKYVAGLAFAVLLYLSVLLHEASHALMAQHYGLPVRSDHAALPRRRHRDRRRAGHPAAASSASRWSAR